MDMAAQPGSTTASTPAPGPAVPASTARTIWRISAVLICIAAAVLVLARVVGSQLARAGHTTSMQPSEIVVGNEVLLVPHNVIRFASQRYLQKSGRLDLHLHWPTLSGYEDGLRDAFTSAEIEPSILFLTVEPRRMSEDMTGRIGPLYSKFLEGSDIDAGHGLRKQGLSTAGGFLEEDLYFDAGSPRRFAARCIREGAKSASPYCLRDIHIGRELMVTYRFHRSLIGDWRRLDGAIRQRLAAMLAD